MPGLPCLGFTQSLNIRVAIRVVVTYIKLGCADGPGKTTLDGKPFQGSKSFPDSWACAVLLTPQFRLKSYVLVDDSQYGGTMVVDDGIVFNNFLSGGILVREFIHTQELYLNH